jgi:hypothetical protein
MLCAFVPQPGRQVLEGSSMVTIGDDLEVKEGVYAKRAVSIGGDVRVYGRVRHEVVSVFGSVYLGSASEVQGDVVSIGGTVDREPGAVVGGEVTIIDASGITAWLTGLPGKTLEDLRRIWGTFGWLSSLGFILLALLVVSVIPAGVGAVSFQIEHYLLRTILWGLFGMALAVPLVGALFISVVGIVMIPVLIGFLGCTVLFGYIAVAQLVGKRIAISVRRPGRPIVLETLIGMAVLLLAGLVPVAGWFVKGVAVFLGFGGVLGALTAGSRAAAHPVPGPQGP